MSSKCQPRRSARIPQNFHQHHRSCGTHADCLVGLTGNHGSAAKEDVAVVLHDFEVEGLLTKHRFVGQEDFQATACCSSCQELQGGSCTWKGLQLLASTDSWAGVQTVGVVVAEVVNLLDAPGHCPAHQVLQECNCWTEEHGCRKSCTSGPSQSMAGIS